MGENPLQDSAKAEQARKALEAEGVSIGATTKDATTTQAESKEAKKAAHHKAILAQFESLKPTLEATLTGCKAALDKSKTIESDEMRADLQQKTRKTVLIMLQEAKLPHRRCVKDDDYEVTRWNNGQAADDIIECLLKGETVEQALFCVYSAVFFGSNLTDEQIMALKRGEPLPVNPKDAPLANGKPGSDETSLTAAIFAGVEPADPEPEEEVELFDPEEPNSDGDDEEEVELFDPTDEVLPPVSADSRLDTTERYLTWLASEFAQRTELVEIDGVVVIVPAAETVTVKQSKTGTWCLYYDSICGSEENPWRGPEDDKFQARYAQPVADQAKATTTDPKDLAAVADLIRDSVPRHSDGAPKLHYPLMTEESAEELKVELGDLLGLNPGNGLLKWFLRELMAGSGPERIRELKAQKDLEFETAREQARAKRKTSTTSTKTSLLRHRSQSSGSATETPAGCHPRQGAQLAVNPPFH